MTEKVDFFARKARSESGAGRFLPGMGSLSRLVLAGISSVLLALPLPGQRGELELRVERVSDRAGAVSIVPTEDLWPGAGRGFAVAFSQHHEQISAFHPTGGGFEERVLYRAPHPNWGTSAIEPADLTAFFALNARVLLEGPEKFVADGERHVRLSVACPRSKVEAGMRRIAAALHRHSDPVTSLG